MQIEGFELQYNQGSIVKIFCDPFTQKKPEGIAELIECSIKNAGINNKGIQQFWYVKFNGEERKLGRWLLNPIKKQGNADE
ncbi:MAG: hypothetical protein PVH88_01870 [Ignavibacteria bacterium]|jgi:hypothetical protein